MSSVCITPTKKQQDIVDNLDTLRSLFDGNAVVEKYNNRKQKKVGSIISDTYGKSTEGFGGKMFDEIVYRATYKPAISSFENFTEGDFRRISNEIAKEAKKLKSGNLNILEKLFFVKRGTMGKYAVTSWMNKHINLATNYERTQYSRYLKDHMLISRLLRTEAIRRDKQSKFRPGIKGIKDLEKIENNLIIAMSMPKDQANADYIQGEYKKLMKSLKEGAGPVLKDFRMFMEATEQTKFDTNTNKSIKAVWKKDENGNVIGRFDPMIIEAGKIARESLNNSGRVLINGMEAHKRVVRRAFLNTSKLDLSNSLDKKVKKYEDKITEEIAAIKVKMKDGNYFPHYLLDTFMSIEKSMENADKEMRNKGKDRWNADTYLDEMSNVFTQAKNNLGTPRAGRFRGREEYEDYLQNPLAVLRQYSMDAIAFNRVNTVKDVYLQGIQKLPKDPEVAQGLKKYLDDIFTLAEKGFQDRPSWVNKTVRAITGYEFFSKIGFGVTTAARNTMSGLYYMQAVGNWSFLSYLKNFNKAPKHIKDAIRNVEKEQGFLFEDMSSELFTEGLLPTEGVRVRDVDIVDVNGKPQLAWRDDKGWKAFDSALTQATGKSAIFQKVTENFLRKHMFRHSYVTKYNELTRGGLQGKDESKKMKMVHQASRRYALDMVNKYAFEYAAHQKAPVTGGTTHTAGSVGQVVAQFFHFPFSFLQMQSEVLKKSKDAAIARQWNSPDLLIPLRFAGLYAFTTLMSGVFNVDFHRLVENDTLERIGDLKDAVSGEDIKGRGYVGPAVGDLFFLASLHDFVEMPDSRIKDLILGYNDAYKLTDEQKHSRLLSTVNVEMSKWVTKDWKALQNGNIWNVMMHEFGLYPRGWTREMRKKEPLKRIFPKQTKLKGKEKKKRKHEVELGKLYRAMGV